MAVTISDVASAADVSKSTVSRVFGAPDQVNQRTRDHVREIAERLGYSPRTSGQSIGEARTGSIGMIVPDIVNPFFPPMIKAVQRRARIRGHAVYIADTDLRVSDEVEAAETMSRQVDGLIFWSSRLADDVLLDIARRVPTVLVNRTVPGIASLLVASADGMRQAVGHLHALGHRKCCYLNGSEQSWSNERRREAVRAGCEELGLELVELGPYGEPYDAGVQAADLLIASGVSAVIAHNDLMAIGVLRQIANRGLSIPGDLSVVGVDDTMLATLSRPALTTVRIPADEIGALAVDLVLDLIGGNVERVTGGPIDIASQLIVRDSTGPVAG